MRCTIAIAFSNCPLSHLSVDIKQRHVNAWRCSCIILSPAVFKSFREVGNLL